MKISYFIMMLILVFSAEVIAQEYMVTEGGIRVPEETLNIENVEADRTHKCVDDCYEKFRADTNEWREDIERSKHHQTGLPKRPIKIVK